MQPSHKISRRAAGLTQEWLSGFRVVTLHGARQVGKTTLARQLAVELGARFVSLDENEDLAAVGRDPATFLRAAGVPLVIDEVQRIGQPLVLAIKYAVDLNNQRGQYLLTGSTNFLTVPTIAESLAGRTALVTLWPLSQGEIGGGSDDFVDRVFAGESAPMWAHQGPVPARDRYFESLCTGGYPEALHISARLRRRFFADYTDTVIKREIELAADVRRPAALNAMVRYFAATTAQELVMSTVANRLAIDRSTADTYQSWLETVFLVHRTPAWSRNLTAKVIKRPKLYLTDTGLATSLLNKDTRALVRLNDPAAGPLFETFIVNEIAKQLTWSETPARMFHFRDSDGPEVDLILESDDGRVVAIEIKATSTPRAEDFRWLELLRNRLDKVGQDFVAGVVLHTGERRLPFGDRLVALPAADVWT